MDEQSPQTSTINTAARTNLYAISLLSFKLLEGLRSVIMNLKQLEPSLFIACFVPLALSGF